MFTRVERPVSKVPRPVARECTTVGLQSHHSWATMVDMTNIALVGANRVGKSTVGSLLEHEYGYTQLRFADPLVELAMLHRDWAYDVGKQGYEGAKSAFPYVRDTLIEIGDVLLKNDPQFLVRSLARKIESFEREWVVTDVRKQAEVDYLASLDFKFIAIHRPDHEVDVKRWGVLNLPGTVLVLNNTGTVEQLTETLKTIVNIARWASGAPAPVLEQQPDPESDGGSADGADGEDEPHWCGRCEAEYPRDPEHFFYGGDALDRRRDSHNGE